MSELKIKELLKPIRKQADGATGIQKIIYDEMLRQINEKFPKGKVTREDLLRELDRQREGCQKNLDEDKKWGINGSDRSP